MKNVKGVSLWMKVVVIVAVVVWCSPVLAGTIAEFDGTDGDQPPSSTLTTDGYGIDAGDQTVTTTGTVSGGTVTGDIVQDNGGASMAGGVVTGTSLTDGTATLTGGSLTDAVDVTASGTVEGVTVTDGAGATMTGGDVDATNVTATDTVEGVTVTDGAGATMTGGDVDATNVTATDTVEGVTVTDGAGATMTGGTVEGVTLQTDTLGVVINDGDVDADGTVTVTDGADTTIITGGTLSVTNSNAVLNVNDSSGLTFQYDNTTDPSSSMTVDSSGAAMTAGNGAVTVTDTQASVIVNNGTADHGLVVGESDTVLSGGTDSTTFTLDDDGALLDNELNMDGNRITNVANGVHRYDAVNKGQLDEVAERAYQGIAAVAAMSAIPQPLSGHRFAIGIGGGTYKEEGAFAIGGSANLTNNLRLTGSVGITSDSAVGAAGIGFSW
jgi:hypothetical protein